MSVVARAGFRKELVSCFTIAQWKENLPIRSIVDSNLERCQLDASITLTKIPKSIYFQTFEGSCNSEKPLKNP
jgi:hypothetical protein